MRDEGLWASKIGLPKGTAKLLPRHRRVAHTLVPQDLNVGRTLPIRAGGTETNTEECVAPKVLGRPTWAVGWWPSVCTLWVNIVPLTDRLRAEVAGYGALSGIDQMPLSSNGH